THPHVSIDATWMRGMYICSDTVRSASLNTCSVASLLPASQCQMWFVSLRSGRTSVAPGSIALYGSTTGGNGSYSTSTAATPSAAAYRLVAMTAATSCD